MHSHDVNDYLREAGSADITAKDIRTWVATVSAAGALGRLAPPASQREEQAAVREVVDAVAHDLGNTAAVCRASYIHPHVLTSFGTGELHETWQETPPRRARLTADERRTRMLLSRQRKSAHARWSVERGGLRAS